MSFRTSSTNRALFQQLLEDEDLDDPQVQKLLQLTENASSDRLQQLANQGLNLLLLQKRVHPFKNNLVPASGSITLGETMARKPYTVDEELLVKHLLAVGQSGAGKTSMFYSILRQLEAPFWCFDLKQDYRHLIHHHDELTVLPWTELKFNPLMPPPEVAPRRWAQVFSEMFGHATSLLSGSKNFLLKSVIELYQAYGLFDDCSPPYPSLHELEAVLTGEKISYVRKKANYRDTILNRVEAMNLGAGTIFDCSQGYSLDQLLQEDVVFEFDGLNRDIQNFVMEILLAWVYEYRLEKTHRDTGLNHVIVLDEGKQVFSVYKERQEAAGIPSIDDLTAKLREFGEGLIVGDQEASKLTDSIKANTYTKTLLPTGDSKQFAAVADSMRLSDRQESVAQQLDTGEAVIQIGNKEPVRAQLHDFQIQKEVTDSELRHHQGRRWEQLSSTPRQRPTGFEEHLSGNNRSNDEVISDPKKDISISPEAKRLLTDVIKYQFVPLTQRYDQFSSHHIGYKAKEELVDAGVVTEHTLRTDSGSRKLLDLTERGRRFVDDNLDLEAKFEGRGGIIHRYWQHHVKEFFEDAGYTAKLEVFDADVYVNTGEVEVVVEIAMKDTKREIEHVKDHLENGFDTVWVACRDDTVRSKLKKRINDSSIETDRIVFHTVADFEESSTNQIPD